MLVLTAASLSTGLSARSVIPGLEDAVRVVREPELAHPVETATLHPEIHVFVLLLVITSGTVQAFANSVLETAQHVIARATATISLLVIAVAVFQLTLQPVDRCNFTMHQVATDGVGIQLVQAILGHLTYLLVLTHSITTTKEITPTSSGNRCPQIFVTVVQIHTAGPGTGMDINSKELLHFTTTVRTAITAGGSTSSNLLVHTHVLAYRTAKQ